MEPRSPWASSHGERESIPTIKIELAGFGIGKLLSLRNTTFTTANGPFPFLHGTHHCAALASSQVQRTRARTRELDMESIREHSDGLEQNRQGADGLAPHNRQGHARCCFEAVSAEVPAARSGSGGVHKAAPSRDSNCRGGRGRDRHRDSQAGGRFL